MHLLMFLMVMIYVVLVVWCAKRIISKEEVGLERSILLEETAFKKIVNKKDVLGKRKKKLENEAIEIFTLYEITKEITSSLNEEDAFEIFKKRLSEHANFEECLFFDSLSNEVKEVRKREDYFVFTLQGKRRRIGYLAIKNVLEEDKEKIMILGHQFALALRRVKLYQEIEKIAITDSLTEVHTRRYVLERFDEEIKRSKVRNINTSFLMIKHRLQIIDIGKKLYASDMIAGNEGNISVKIRDDCILTTPTGLCKGLLKPEDLVEVDFEGKQNQFAKGRPSSELPMHLIIYEVRPDVNAIVHAHPITATGFALAGIAFDHQYLPEIVMTFGSVPLAKYGTPSTCELSEEVAKQIKNRNGLLLANHGAVTVGKDLNEAFFRMEILEHYAKIVLVAIQVGQPKELSPEDRDKLRALMNNSTSELKTLLSCKM